MFCCVVDRMDGKETLGTIAFYRKERTKAPNGILSFSFDFYFQ